MTAGYAAARRIERIEVRGGFAARPFRTGSRPVEAPPRVAVVELTGRDLGEHLRERVADLRIYLGQLTWYLFNAEGWR
jgi:hypothetical protein